MINHKTYLSDLKIEFESTVDSGLLRLQVRCYHKGKLKMQSTALTREQCKSITDNILSDRLTYNFIDEIEPVLQDYLFDCIADAKTIWNNE